MCEGVSVIACKCHVRAATREDGKNFFDDFLCFGSHFYFWTSSVLKVICAKQWSKYSKPTWRCQQEFAESTYSHLNSCGDGLLHFGSWDERGSRLRESIGARSASLSDMLNRFTEGWHWRWRCWREGSIFQFDAGYNATRNFIL